MTHSICNSKRTYNRKYIDNMLNGWMDGDTCDTCVIHVINTWMLLMHALAIVKLWMSTHIHKPIK
jgi:hypothetical protein